MASFGYERLVVEAFLILIAMKELNNIPAPEYLAQDMINSDYADVCDAEKEILYDIFVEVFSA